MSWLNRVRQSIPFIAKKALIYQALGLALPGELDAFATFSDRLAAHKIRVTEDPYTGADLLVGVKLKPEHAPFHALRAEAFCTCLTQN